MSEELPTSETTYTAELTPQQPAYESLPESLAKSEALRAPVSGTVISPDQVTLLSYPVPKPVPDAKPKEKVICFDTEATGTNPWDYRLLVCSFWDLSKPLNTMVTFADWDEEKLTRDIAAYLNEEKPDALLCYNNGYDQRALLTRFMYYRVPVPGWNKIKQYDMMEILKKGTLQNIYSSQNAGTEEDWLKYFYDESKPYTIDECFEGVREGSLERFIIRNRTCTYGVGIMYLLFLYVTEGEIAGPELIKPTAIEIEEAVESGLCAVKCEVCGAVNVVECGSEGNQCWRCLAALPVATEESRVRELEHPYDFSKVGLKETSSRSSSSKSSSSSKKSSTSKTSTSKK